VQNPGDRRALERDGRESVLALFRIHAGLNDFNLDRTLRLVVHLDGSMPHAAVVVTGVHVLEKIRRGDRRARLIDLDHDVAQFRLHAHANDVRARLGRRRWLRLRVNERGC
jgi:hypothetical protein